MASPFATISKQIAAGFRGQLTGPLYSGKIYVATPDSLDDYGDPSSSTPTLYPFQGIRSNYDAKYATQAGIPVTDVNILIINGLTKAPLPIQQTYKFFIFGQWYAARQVPKVDPANATTEVQGYVIPDPTVAS